MFKVHCDKCKSGNIIKNGHNGIKQRYQCKECKHRFIYKRNHISKVDIYKEFVIDEMKLEQLAKKYNKSVRTISNYIKEVRESDFQFDLPTDMEIILEVDATYFNKKDGILLACDHITGKVVYIKRIISESKKEFQEMLIELKNRNIKIKGCVSDGIKALRELLSGVSHQYCQVHATRRVEQLIGKKPKDKAAKSLLSIARKITKCGSDYFKKLLDKWYHKYHNLLEEEELNLETLKLMIKYKELRDAYNFLVNNFELFFTFEKCEGLPKDNNRMEGIFSQFKTGFKIHRGISPKTREKYSLIYFNKFNVI